MRDYEVMWILGGDASEEDGEASVARVSKLVVDSGGEVTHTGFWGHRTLAYPIDKNVEGAYYLARFAVEPDALDDFERGIAADQAIIRHLLTKLDSRDGAKVTPQTMDAAPPERARRPSPGRRS